MKDQNSEDKVIQVQERNIVGQNIRKYRLRQGLKQAELVKKLQISGIDISVFGFNRIEKGTQNPSVSLLLVLCSLLHCDMNALFSFPEPQGCPAL